MKKNLFKYFFLLGFLLCIGSAFAQKKTELERKRDDLSKKIKYTNNLISKTASDRQTQQSQLNLINKQIGLREELVKTINKEVNTLERQITTLQDSLNIKKKQLVELKEEYAKLIQIAARNKSDHNKLMFIFASDNFNQAFSRLKYLSQYTEYRKEQGKKIVATNEQIAKSISMLEKVRNSKEVLLSAQISERRKLQSDVNQKKDKLTELQKQEVKLKQDLAAQKREKQQTQKAIQDLIAAEIAKNKKSSGGTFVLTPEAKALSSSFESNKGKLPWPVTKGVITGKFGKQPHPVLRNVTIENNGVTITTEREAEIRAIFKGKVSNVLVIPGAGKVVVLDHGAYRSIYTNLKEVFVSKGMQVDTKSAIGVALAADKYKSEAHLEIWKITNGDTQKLNPALWIYRR